MRTHKSVTDLGQPKCGRVQEGDEYKCPNCFMRWGTDEERPECLVKRSK